MLCFFLVLEGKSLDYIWVDEQLCDQQVWVKSRPMSMKIAKAVFTRKLKDVYPPFSKIPKYVFNKL